MFGKEATPWTEEEIERLKELCKASTIPAIVKELGKSHHAIRHQIRKNGLTTKCPWERSLTEVNKVWKYSEEHGIKAASEKFNLTEYVVKNIRKRHKSNLKRTMEALSPEKITKIRKAAFGYAYKRRSTEAEDFASFVTERLLKNSYGSVNLNWLWPEYLRSNFGSTKSEKGLARIKGGIRETQITEDFDEDNPGVQVADPESGKDAFAIVRVAEEHGLKDYDRYCFVAYFQYGLRQNEIALILGISPPRVSQIIEEVTTKLRLRGFTEL